MTARYTLPVSAAGGGREVLAARLWAAGASGVWDRGDELVAWFPRATAPVPPGGRWEDEPLRDWLEDWRRGLDPVHLGPLTITPSWRLDEVAADDPIVIDPGMAFGTGHHATTRFCVERLVALQPAGARVLDVGTGTGILAIAADRLGAASVVAVDHDRDAVDVAVANVGRNAAAVEVRHGGVEAAAEDAPFDIVLANLVTDTILELALDLVRVTRRGGWLVASGIGRDRCHEVVAALLAAGTDAPTVRAEPTWSEVTARRTPA